MKDTSPSYQMDLIKKVETTIWKKYESIKNVSFYIQKWHKSGYDECGGFCENFNITYQNDKDIDLSSTLHNMDGELVLKIAIDLGIETPNYIPAIPIFRNELKSSYKTASRTFEKALKCVESDPSMAIGLANSALESIIKEILNDSRIVTKWNPNNTLYKLAHELIDEFQLPSNIRMPMEIKKISSSLLNIAQSIEGIRSDKTEFHGKTSSEDIVTDPIFAYLCVNAVSTVGLFFLSYYEKKYPDSMNI